MWILRIMLLLKMIKENQYKSIIIFLCYFIEYFGTNIAHLSSSVQMLTSACQYTRILSPCAPILGDFFPLCPLLKAPVWSSQDHNPSEQSHSYCRISIALIFESIWKSVPVPCAEKHHAFGLCRFIPVKHHLQSSVTMVWKPRLLQPPSLPPHLRLAFSFQICQRGRWNYPNLFPPNRCPLWYYI